MGLFVPSSIALKVVVVTCIPIASCAVAGRLWVRQIVQKGRIGIDDWLIILSLVSRMRDAQVRRSLTTQAGCWYCYERA